MIDFLAGLLLGATVAYFVGRRHGYIRGYGEATKSGIGYAIRKQNETGWPARADRDDYGQKTEK